MSVLEGISDPADLRALTPDELHTLTAEIRAFLVDRVARTGGHLGPNLGVVELTIALHRVFNTPRDYLLWDTGHQAYVHKILTGRRAGFTTLRQAGGLSGYPSRAESPHDHIENSHASTSLSYADGIAKGLALSGELGQRKVVAVIGDGALTGGMAWEALNNIAASDRPVVIVVNDNRRSYSPTIGGLAQYLGTLRTARSYERAFDWGRDVLGRTPVVGPPLFEALHGMKKGLKDIVAPQGMFEDLGLKYLGPVDGHDLADLERTLRMAAGFPGPVIVHVITEKGRGYPPAEEDEADRFHGVGVIDPVTGRPLAGRARTWTDVFSEEMLQIGAARPDVVAITAAMLGPTGLSRFAESYPQRTFDVGIAEQHAVTSATGLAMVGYHPVFAVYATFLNRAFDQVLMDAALHHAGMTIVLDRAGVTGDDGASHNGMWDMAMLSVVPGLHLAAPRDEATLRRALQESVGIPSAPSVVRFPKGAVGPGPAVVGSHDGIDLLWTSGDQSVLIIAVGHTASAATEAAASLANDGVGVVVASPLWVKPVPAPLIDLAHRASLVVVVEDGCRTGGIGSQFALAAGDDGVAAQVRTIGIPAAFLAHGSRGELLAELGLTAPAIVSAVSQMLAQPRAEALPG